jgi:hypothetical protein
MAGRGMGAATKGGGAVGSGPKNRMVSTTSKKTGPVMMADGGMARSTGLANAAARSGRTMPTTGRPAMTGQANAAAMSGRTMPRMKKGGAVNQHKRMAMGKKMRKGGCA